MERGGGPEHRRRGAGKRNSSGELRPFRLPGLCSLENHPLASLISLILQVFLFKHHFLIPHTDFKKNEAKLSLLTRKKALDIL